MRTLVASLAISISLWLTGVAAAQDASPDVALGQARELVLYARYPEAITAGQALLARTDLSATQRNATLELIATAQIANRQPADARQTLATLYARDPGHRLSDPDASPPVISAFARAREARPQPIALGLQHESPGTLARREPPVIELRVGDGADAVSEVRLAYRTAGEPGYSQVVMNPRSGTWTARIPVVGTSDRALDVAYYLTVLAPSGAELGRVGSDAEPLQLRIPAEVPDPRGVAIAANGEGGVPLDGTERDGGGGSVAEEPWFWVIIGVLVAGGVAAGVIVATQPAGGPDQGTLGTVTLMR
ncbi:hypothetical protein [Sandaracinus amylolyticus]|uniref:Tetratricopeptide repeat protein n=1 Tax=Sandaracinus amylolyticus TaxID=927083 RepID=A0A0F6SGF3_9BACT|nr:hypothetical protein [Sandaracinus amylolyticus]AKF08594.1 hypothetical protein DB32_005743 [Sandaracinus amylolyticus]